MEARRLALQAELDAAKSATERNKLGQFATPTDLASDVLSYARTLMPPGAAVRFLDPAIGTGAFYSALLREFDRRRIATATGFEIDPHYEKPTRALWREHPLELKLADFTRTLPPEKGAGHNLIICNPPYVRHHHLDKATKHRLRAAAGAASGVMLAGLAGLYCYFLALSHAWMEPGAVAGWLVPSEFMDVNYGAPLKEYLLHQVELVRIHRFDPRELQFTDAAVSSAIVWFRRRQPESGHKVEFSYGGTLAKPKRSRLAAISELRAPTKWTRIAAEGLVSPTAGPQLADFFAIKRGLATGNNAFFILTRAQIAAHRLPLRFFRPILPGPRHLEADVIAAYADGTPKLARQLFLLDCCLPESEVEAHHPALWAYLQTGKETVAETYLCSRRTPWYGQENRPPAPFVCTYMGRNLATRDKPFRFLWNRSQATAANVYLLLYPKAALAKVLAGCPERERIVWEFLCALDSATLLGEGRVYGGGLYKLEPRELAKVPAAALAERLPALAGEGLTSDPAAAVEPQGG